MLFGVVRRTGTAACNAFSVGLAAEGTDEQVIVEGTEAQEPVEAAEQGFDEEGEEAGVEGC